MDRILEINIDSRYLKASPYRSRYGNFNNTVKNIVDTDRHDKF